MENWPSPTYRPDLIVVLLKVYSSDHESYDTLKVKKRPDDGAFLINVEISEDKGYSYSLLSVKYRKRV